VAIIEISGGLGGFVEWVRSWAMWFRVLFFLFWIVFSFGIFFDSPLLRVKARATANTPAQIIEQSNIGRQEVGVGSANSVQANASGAATAVAGDVYVGPNFFSIADVGSSRERREIRTPSGAAASADIYVLWQEGAWHFNSDDVFLRRDQLQTFLESSLMRSALSDSAAIACVGLASNESAERSASAEDYNEDLSNRRAFHLCNLLAGRTAALHTNPTLFGVGLGFNTQSASDTDARQKQRAVVFIAVRGAQPLSRPDIDAVVREILRDGSLTDFQPQHYSRVTSRETLCWVRIERGVYRPPDCR
jgi:hypothetical protein